MIVKQPSFSFGIEEEYFLVNRETRGLAAGVPPALIAACRRRLGDRFSLEFMDGQVEACTPVCTDMASARVSLIEARHTISEEAAKFGLAPIAAATHPSAKWRDHAPTDVSRYHSIAEEFQAVGRRMLINGLHVHFGITGNSERIRLMNDVRPILPLLLALSTSSPFWQGEMTGLKSYRTAINDATPRKGIPEAFTDWRDYQRTVGALKRAGIIEDGSKIWWDLRPSAKHPTLEMRITDACPLLEDSLCLAAIFCCWCRYLSRDHDSRWAKQPLALINENRWRAQRYGLDEGLIDPPTGRLVAIDGLVEELLGVIAEDAVECDCLPEVEHARTILTRGTSADRQLAIYHRLNDEGRLAKTAMHGVVDQLVRETSAPGGAGRAPILSRSATVMASASR